MSQHSEAARAGRITGSILRGLLLGLLLGAAAINVVGHDSVQKVFRYEGF